MLGEEEAHERLRRRIEALKNFLNNVEGQVVQRETVEVNSTMLEEELVHALSKIDSHKVGLDFFVEMGQQFYIDEAYELLNVVKTHIEYNFNVKLTNENGITKYEIHK